MSSGVVRGYGFFMLRIQGVEVAGEFSEGGFGFARAQFAGLLEGREGVVDARYGLFVGVDVEVADCVVDELSISWFIFLFSWRWGYVQSRGPRREAFWL